MGAVVGEAPVRLETGDIVLFPHGDPHVISSEPGMRAPSDAAGEREPGPRTNQDLGSSSFAGSACGARNEARRAYAALAIAVFCSTKS